MHFALCVQIHSGAVWKREGVVSGKVCVEGEGIYFNLHTEISCSGKYCKALTP